MSRSRRPEAISELVHSDCRLRERSCAGGAKRNATASESGSVASDAGDPPAVSRTSRAGAPGSVIAISAFRWNADVETSTARRRQRAE